MRLVAAVVVVGLAAAISAFVWLTVGGNTAGWIVGFLAAFAILGVEVSLDAEAWYKRDPRSRSRRAILFGAFALAVFESVLYIFWSGTLSWYLIGLFALPLVFVLTWARSDDDVAPPGTSDGPWAAP